MRLACRTASLFRSSGISGKHLHGPQNGQCRAAANAGGDSRHQGLISTQKQPTERLTVGEEESGSHRHERGLQLSRRSRRVRTHRAVQSNPPGKRRTFPSADQRHGCASQFCDTAREALWIDGRPRLLQAGNGLKRQGNSNGPQRTSGARGRACRLHDLSRTPNNKRKIDTAKSSPGSGREKVTGSSKGAVTQQMHIVGCESSPKTGTRQSDHQKASD